MRERARYLYRAARYRMGSDAVEIRFLLGHLRRGGVALDVGAHKGGYLYWLQRRAGPGGKVYAFEPQAELASYLGRVRAGFGWAHVEIVEAALSEATGEGRLVAPDPGSPGARLSPGVAEGEGAMLGLVRTIALDDFRASLGGRRVEVIKCDVEGHELEVFRGGRALLEEDRPALLFECEARHRRGGSMEEVWEFLRGLGYEGSFVCGRALRPLSEFSPERHQARVGERFWDAPGYCNNFAFVHRDAGWSVARRG